MYDRGWFQLAFESELTQAVTPIDFGSKRLMIVKRGDTLAVFDADCPHRGAHLPSCGQLRDDVIVCGFHGHRIRLGDGGSGELRLSEYATFVHEGLVWVRLSDEPCPDLPSTLRQLAQDHTFIPGFDLSAETTVEIVIENGFDAAHFPAVHGLSMEPVFSTRRGEHDQLCVDGVFEFPRSHWNQDRTTNAPVNVDYRGAAFSPGVFVASLEGEAPFNYRIITTAMPSRRYPQSTVRVTLVLPKGNDGGAPDDFFVKSLLDASRDGLHKDRTIWNGINLDCPNRYTRQDHAALAFHEFCRGFAPAAGVAHAQG